MYRAAPRIWLLGCVIMFGLLGCGGNYSGAVVDDSLTQPADPSPAPSPPPGGGPTSDEDRFFAERVQPRLDFCRTCHVPDGVADVPDGERFLLDPDPAQDATRLQQSWQQLGGNNPVSRLLTMASGEEEHSGGAPWPQNSQAYIDVRAQLRCYADPDNCSDYIAEAEASEPEARANRKAELWQLAGQIWQGRSGPGCTSCHGAPQLNATIVQPDLRSCGQQHPALALPLWRPEVCVLLNTWVAP